LNYLEKTVRQDGAPGNNQSRLKKLDELDTEIVSAVAQNGIRQTDDLESRAVQIPLF